jgi:hypothetical protein
MLADGQTRDGLVCLSFRPRLKNSSFYVPALLCRPVVRGGVVIGGFEFRKEAHFHLV